MMPPMTTPTLRILMLTDVYFPRINGVSTSIETFRADLARENVGIHLVAPAYPERQEHEDIWRVPSRRLPFDPEDRLMRWRHLLATSHQAAQAGIDLIHVQTPFAAHYAGLKTARHLGVPILTTYHTHFEEYIQHYLPLLPKPWLKATARRIARHQCDELDAVIVPSAAMRDTLTHYGVRAPLHVLPTGIPIDRFRHGDGRRFRTRHGIPAGRPVALYVGRIAHEKNIGFLLQAMTHALPRRRGLLLIVAGEGPALPSLKRQVEDLGLQDHVRFVGYLDRQEELPDCYAAANLFVFASRTETQGLVLLEAMAAGVPVIALAEMGTVDILSPGRGSFSPPADPHAFGEALGHFLSRPTAWRHLADEAPIYAREWSDGAMAQRLADLYRNLRSPQFVPENPLSAAI